MFVFLLICITKTLSGFSPIYVRFVAKMRQSLGAQDTWRAIKDGGYGKTNKRLNTGMAPTCDWMIKIVKVNNLYLNSLLVSMVNRVSQMKYQCENTDESIKKWLLT